MATGSLEPSWAPCALPYVGNQAPSTCPLRNNACTHRLVHRKDPRRTPSPPTSRRPSPPSGTTTLQPSRAPQVYVKDTRTMALRTPCQGPAISSGMPWGCKPGPTLLTGSSSCCYRAAARGPHSTPCNRTGSHRRRTCRRAQGSGPGSQREVPVRLGAKDLQELQDIQALLVCWLRPQHAATEQITGWLWRPFPGPPAGVVQAPAGRPCCCSSQPLGGDSFTRAFPMATHRCFFLGSTAELREGAGKPRARLHLPGTSGRAPPQREDGRTRGFSDHRTDSYLQERQGCSWQHLQPTPGLKP